MAGQKPGLKATSLNHSKTWKHMKTIENPLRPSSFDSPALQGRTTIARGHGGRGDLGSGGRQHLWRPFSAKWQSLRPDGGVSETFEGSCLWGFGFFVGNCFGFVNGLQLLISFWFLCAWLVVGYDGPVSFSSTNLMKQFSEGDGSSVGVDSSSNQTHHFPGSERESQRLRTGGGCFSRPQAQQALRVLWNDIIVCSQLPVATLLFPSERSDHWLRILSGNKTICCWVFEDPAI